MRVAVVAGPDPGHAFPAIALSRKLAARGHDPIVITGRRWLAAAAAEGFETRALPGLAPRERDDDADAGARLHERSAYIGGLLAPELAACAPDLVVSDTLTAGGAFAAELVGLPWVELCPHPLYLPSKGLPPIGSGLAPGVGWRGRARDAALRRATAVSIRRGERQRRAARKSVGLPGRERPPAARLIATIPALEVARPDWPREAHVVGPLWWDPAAETIDPPAGDDPLVVVSPSTASVGALGMTEAALSGLAPESMGDTPVRVVVTRLSDGDTPPDTEAAGWARVGAGRQDAVLARARLVVCGGGHGMLAKALCAGLPCVIVPGGGDQWELANRAARAGSAVIVRPLTPEALREAVRRVLRDPSYAAAARRAAAGAHLVADPVDVCLDAADRAAHGAGKGAADRGAGVLARVRRRGLR